MADKQDLFHALISPYRSVSSTQETAFIIEDSSPKSICSLQSFLFSCRKGARSGISEAILDAESLNAMIEAAVYELTHGFIEIGEAVEVASDAG